MKIRNLSLFLSIIMFFSTFSDFTPVFYAESKKNIDPMIMFNGKRVNSVTLKNDQKETLSVVADTSDLVGFQWQILIVQNSEWVDIYDKDKDQCEISYALVKNMLDENNTAYVRCKIITENSEKYTNKVGIEVSFDDIVVEPEKVEKVLISEIEIIEDKQTDKSSVDPEDMSGKVKALSDAKEYVTVTINYLDYDSYANGETPGIVYDPYIATLEKGSSFVQTVVSPTFIGFEPYYAKDLDGTVDDSAISIPLNYLSIEDNIEINVYYKASLVNFATKFFFQNINDDLYTEDTSLYRVDTAYTGTVIEDEYFEKIIKEAGKDTGFQKLFHYPEGVAADGSTVMECYYDRNYYLLQFDLDGGYGTEPIYARYDAPFIANTPIKHGYTFTGWDKLITDTDNDGVLDTGDGIKDELPSTIPAENQHYKALWTTTETTYTIVYWRENAEDNSYSYWGSEKKEAISASTVDGSDSIPSSITTATINGEEVNEKPYFTYNDALTDKNVFVEGDGTTIVNIYYNRNYYSITFKAPGICTIAPNHTHTEECYEYICHVHDTGCNPTLTCTKTVHPEHDENCVIFCNKTEHTESDHKETCCGKAVHSDTEHIASCWENVGSKRNSRPSGAPTSGLNNGYVYKRNSNNYYIYINNSWYNFNGTASTGTIMPTICHKHGDGDCGDFICHKHNDSCYEHETHVHNTECYEYNCDFGSHTHEEECKRLLCTVITSHTHSSTCNSSGSNNVVKIVKRKYQQSISDIWPILDDNGVLYNSGERWSPSDSSIYSEVLVHMESMPADDFTLTLSLSSNSLKTMNYYLQVLPGEEYDKELNGYYFKLDQTITAKYGYVTKAEDFFDINGFDKYTSDPEFSSSYSGTTIDFYYTRRPHILEFENNGASLDDNKQSDILYGQSLKEFYFEPEYPSNLEPNAYYFDGWYTTSGCYSGTEVNWDTATMPDDDLLLYAKWSAKVHTVNFFTTYDEMIAFEKDSSSVVPYESKNNIAHGNAYGSITTPTVSGSDNLTLNFAGWFYMENGDKKAFSSLKQPINRDMNIFADWSSNVSEPYYIEYVLLSDNSVHVADSSTGYGYYGSTKTFIAKAGAPYNQLYNQYNSGTFPTSASHSIVMQHEDLSIENASDWEKVQHNRFKFEYVQASDITYTVRYVNKETNVVMEEVTHTTDSAVVTERFKSFSGMVPDAFYKRLVIAVEEDENGEWVGSDENILTFYYTPNKTSAYYAVHFMMEKLHDPSLSDEEIAELRADYDINGNGGYEESGTHVEGIGNIGSDVTFNPQSFAGFTLIESKGIELDWNKPVEGQDQTYTTTASNFKNNNYTISIDEQGTELYIFYSRNQYDYTVNYVDYNTKKPVIDTSTNREAEPYTGTALYGSSVEVTAPSFNGYTLVTSSETQTIKITNNSTANKYTFYYIPVQYNIEYIVVDAIGGYVTPTRQTLDSNTRVEGSVPAAYEHYVFEGWYLDEKCTQPVDSDLVDKASNKLTPLISDLSDTKVNKFYARFVPNVTSMTINLNYLDGIFNNHDSEQTFIFNITGEGYSSNIAIKGEGSAVINNLTPGIEYTVTLNDNWSWNYSSVSSKKITLDADPNKNIVNFGVALENKMWFDLGAYCKNIFTEFDSSGTVIRRD